MKILFWRIYWQANVRLRLKTPGFTRVLKKHTDEMEAIHNVSLGLTGSLQLQEILNIILRSIIKFLNDAQDSHIFLYREDKLEFGAAIWADGKVGSSVFQSSSSWAYLYQLLRQAKMIVIVPDY